MGYLTLGITNKFPEICTGGLEPFAKVRKPIHRFRAKMEQLKWV